jgi:hypothetical protein
MTDKDQQYRLYALSNDELEQLTDAATELVSRLYEIMNKHSGIIPPALANACLDLEVECCEELTRRGLIDDDEEDSAEYTPVDLPMPLPLPANRDEAMKNHFRPYFDFIESLDDIDDLDKPATGEES